MVPDRQIQSLFRDSFHRDRIIVVLQVDSIREWPVELKDEGILEVSWEDESHPPCCYTKFILAGDHATHKLRRKQELTKQAQLIRTSAGRPVILVGQR